MTTSDGRNRVSRATPIDPAVPTELRERLLQFRLSGRRTARQDLIPVVSRDEPLVLSFGQQRLWFLDLLEPGGTSYLIPLALRLSGRLGESALRRAVEGLVARHEVLRTRYVVRSGVPVQVVDAPGSVDWDVVEVAGSPAVREERLAELVAAEGRQPLDLTAGPVLRARLFRCGVDDHVLLLVLHHISCDGWSLGVLTTELRELYAGFTGGDGAAGLAPVAVQYADFAAWQRSWLSGDVLDQELRYWRDKLAGMTPLELPTDRPRPPVADARGDSVSVAIPRQVAEPVLDLARARGATPFMALLAVFSVLLSRYAGQADVTVGTPVAGRNRRDLHEAVGFFVNTLAIRTSLRGDLAFVDLVDRVRETTLDAFGHQNLPFERLADVLGAYRDLSRNPIFQVAFTFQNTPAEQFRVGELIGEELPLDWKTAKFDLSLQVTERPDGSLAADLEFATALFDRTTVERMARHYLQLLVAIAADPGRPVHDLEMLTGAELAQLLGLNQKRADGNPSCLHELFEDQALRTPDAIAVVDGDRLLTYADLDAHANALARRLRSLGVRPGHTVGIFLERSAEVVIAIVGVLKAGGCYLPLDLDYPPGRLTYIIEDAGAELIVSQQHLQERLPSLAVKVIMLETNIHAMADSPRVSTTVDDLAYIIYTSGSTGQPKGVMVTHANAVRLFSSTEADYRFGPEDIWTLFHSYAFDFSVWEIWGALLHGGRIVVVPYEVSRSPQELLEMVVRERVTVLCQTPSSFRGLVDAVCADDQAPARWALRFVVFGGEALDLQTLAPWYERCNPTAPQLMNMYGITETTVHSTVRALSQDDIGGPVRGPIGRPLRDLSVYVLDDRIKPMPIGAPGEIYIGGPGVARGYLGRPDLTAERFVPDAFGRPGQRLYRTGDKARILPSGELDFLGRLDEQIKIRGFRVELGEVETRLAAHPAVAACAVMVRASAAAEPQLVGYVVPADGRELHVPELRKYLATWVPSYMVPAQIIILPKFPLTSNGKVDRQALPAPGGTRPELADAYVPPRTPVEQLIVNTWGEVLGLDRIGVDDDFFDLGGDSIRAVQLVGQLARRGFGVSVQDLFRNRTVAELAGTLRTSQLGAEEGTEPFALLPSGRDRYALPDDVVDAYPLSMVQAGMLYEMLADTRQALYHNATCYWIRDDRPLSVPALRRAAQMVVDRHEVLRTSFDLAADGEPIQRVHRKVMADFAYVDLRGSAPEEHEAAIRDALEAERRQLFWLEQAPLLRLRVQQLSEREWPLILTECHAILDGWSHNSLLAELLTTYHTLRAGAQVDDGGVQAAVGVRFADFVALERTTVDGAEHRAFWASRLDGLERFTLPDGWGEQSATDPFVEIQVAFDDLEADLRRLGSRCRASLKSVLLAGHVMALAAVSGQRHFYTGLVCNGRLEREGGDRAFGMFLNTVPFAMNLAGRSREDVVRAVAEEEAALLPHRRFPLPAMQREWGQGEPLLQSAFNFLDFRVLSQEAVDFGKSIDISHSEFALLVSTNPGALLIAAHTRRVDHENAEFLGRVHRWVLEAMVRNPDGPAGCGFLPQEFRQELLAAWNATAVAVPDRTVHELVVEQARTTPGRIALVDADSALTYAELDHRSAVLAGRLRALGVGVGTVVGVCLNRRLDLVVALLAVLRVGGAYLPLDPQHPIERTLYMLDDAQVRVLLVHRGSRPDAQLPDSTRLVYVDDVPDDAGEPPGEVVVHPQSPAYVIYTSGSTGRPKGVVIPHRAVINLLCSVRDRPGLSSDDVLVAVATVSFDIAIVELFLPLICGARVVLASREDAVDALRLRDLISASQATILQATPSTWRMLREVHWRPPEGFKVLSTGEKLPLDLAGWIAGSGASGWDLYGPTETTVYSSVSRLGSGGQPTDWAPIANTTIYVLDADLEPVLPGTAGEVYIGGLGLASGYHQRPELTAERFLPNPHGTMPGARLYRTGDLGRRSQDSAVEILGRTDYQVKIRGYRIEPGEIEAVLSHHPALAAAVVQPTRTNSGWQLTVYAVGRDGGAPAAGDLRPYLARQLPPYMVPTTFFALDRLPLTANGKVDRRALASLGPSMGRPDRIVMLPRTPDEEALAAVWTQVLGVEDISIYDDFFDLGGHSLLAMRVVVAAREKHGIERIFRDIMTHRTIASVLAAQMGESGDPSRALVWFRREGAERPLFCVHPGGGSAHWYTHLAQELGGGQPLAAFEWPGLHGITEHPGSVQQMAERYVGEMRNAQPVGPYRLLGWCGSSGVAWEMARLLDEAGERVNLFLLDPVVDVAERENLGDELRLFWRCEGLFAALATATDESTAEELREEIAEILRIVVDDQRGVSVTAGDIDEPWQVRVRTCRQLLETMREHSFEPYRGRVHLLTGDEVARSSHEAMYGLSYEAYLARWRQLAAGGLEVHRVSGDHLGVLLPPQVADLAGQLTELFGQEKEGPMTATSD